MDPVGTPAVDVDRGTPPRWRRRRAGHWHRKASSAVDHHDEPNRSALRLGFIPLLVGRGLGAQAPGPLVLGAYSCVHPW